MTYVCCEMITTFKIKLFSLWWELLGFTMLATFQYNILQYNHSYHVIHYIPSTYLSYNWEFIPFDHLYSVPLLVTTNLTSFLVVVFFCMIPPISGIIQYLFFFTYFTLHKALKVLPCWHKWVTSFFFMAE